MMDSDLLKAVGFHKVTCPYTGEELVAVRAIAPDVAFLHVQKADEEGNACISGPVYEDSIIAKAAKKVVLTAEEIVPGSFFAQDPHRADIPAAVTTAVVHLPGGARPCAVSGCYDMDREELRSFLAAKEPQAALAAAGLEGRELQ
jgi:glutaconate CoA-transferase subunit A